MHLLRAAVRECSLQSWERGGERQRPETDECGRAEGWREERVRAQRKKWWMQARRKETRKPMPVQ